MTFTEHTLGVKIQNNFVTLESCNTFGDLRIYDFIYTDFVSSNWNGNICYGSKITNISTGKDFYVINGWKLINLSFPGDWFGNYTRIELEDKFGERTTIGAPVGKAIYADSFKHLIREGLLEAVRFTKENPCVEYKEIIDGLNPIHGSLNIEEFHKLVESVDSYIAKYLNLKDKLVNEEFDNVKDKLRVAVSENVSKLFGLSIKIE